MEYVYIHAEYRACLTVAQEISLCEHIHLVANPMWILYYLYYPLAHTAIYFEGDARQKALCKKILRASLQKTKRFSQTCPENYLHKHLLLLAERARICGKQTMALQLYSQSIAEAKKQGFQNEEALGYELKAKCLLAAGQSQMAAEPMQQAYRAYDHGGANAKLRQLKAQFPSLLAAILPAADAPAVNRTTSINTTMLTTVATNIEFDITSMIQASQTISGEIVLEKLLSNLMHIVIVNAGADLAYLILAQQKHQVVHAKANLVQESIEQIQPLPVEDMPDELCVAVVQYVQRSQQVLLLNNATQEGNFVQDPYISQQHPQSILRLPLIHRGKLVGILYLENRISKKAFSPERLRILTLLSSQMAISIENALFYAHLEAKVEERTHALKEKNRELEEALRHLQVMQKQLVQQEKMASLGLLTTGIAHELKNPLNFVINFSELSRPLIDEIALFIQKYTQNAPSNESADMQVTVKELLENIEAIKAQGSRADGIVEKMSAHAVKQSKKLEPTVLHAFLDTILEDFPLRMAIRYPSLNVTIVKEFDPSVQYVELNPEDMLVVIRNLLENAYFALMKKKQMLGESFVPTLTIRTEQMTSQITIHFRDNGIGIPLSVQEKIFSPFFTSKAAGPSTGLGLSLSYNIVTQQHGGILMVNSQEGQYTEFTIVLLLKGR